METISVPKYINKGFYKHRQNYLFVCLNNTQQLLFATKETQLVIFGVYSFNRQYKIMQKLNIKNQITCLEFMKKSNHFITGHFNSTISIWDINQNYQWNILKILQGHHTPIRCLLLSNTEDQIISGGGDEKIKFWNKYNDWECVQTVEIKQSNTIFGLCLNEVGNKLVCTGFLNIVSILNLSSQGLWQIVQTIIVESGYYCVFINNDVFTYIPDQNSLEIYEFDVITNKFQKTQNVITQNTYQCYYGFKQKVIKDKQLLIIKKGQLVNLIQITTNKNFEILQSLKFRTFIIFGDISNNGSILFVNDSRAGQISFSKLNSQKCDTN